MRRMELNTATRGTLQSSAAVKHSDDGQSPGEEVSQQEQHAEQLEVEPLLENHIDSGDRGSYVLQVEEADDPNAKPVPPKDQTFKGLMLYALWTLFFALMSICIKVLGNRGMPVFEILVARCITITGFCLLKCLIWMENPMGNRRGLLVIRGIVGACGVITSFFSVTLLPLQDAIVFQFLTPMWVAIIGPCLGEKGSWKVFFTIPVCLVGVALIAQPTFLAPILGRNPVPLNPIGVAIALVQGVVWAIINFLVRYLMRTESADVLTFYNSICTLSVALAGCFLPKVWGATGTIRAVDGMLEWTMLVGVGVFGYLGQIVMSEGLKRAKAASATAMSYLAIVWSIIASLVIFHEVPTVLSIVGAVLICSCTFTLALGIKKQVSEDGPEAKPADDEASTAVFDEDARLLVVEALDCGPHGSPISPSSVYSGEWNSANVTAKS